MYTCLVALAVINLNGGNDAHNKKQQKKERAGDPGLAGRRRHGRAELARSTTPPGRTSRSMATDRGTRIAGGWQVQSAGAELQHWIDQLCLLRQVQAQHIKEGNNSWSSDGSGRRHGGFKACRHKCGAAPRLLSGTPTLHCIRRGWAGLGKRRPTFPWFPDASREPATSLFGSLRYAPCVPSILLRWNV